MATDKALRSAPAKLLNNYVASIRSLNPGENFVSVPDESFLDENFVGNGGTITPSAKTNVPLGFSVTINNINYSQIYISEYGWAFLQKPGVIASSAHVLISTSTNHTLKSSFSYEHIFLSPWWDIVYVPLKNVDLLASNATYNSTITATILADIKSGANTKNWPYSLKDRGARYRNVVDPKNGKGFIVRWTTSQLNFNSKYFGSKFKFECAIFENGNIQFRYFPSEAYEQGNYLGSSSPTTATAGIFWNGTTAGTANRFRDFAPLLGYRRDERNISELGGSSYAASYSETTSGYTTYFSHNIPVTYWPKNGAVITFAPPVKPLKVLPRKMVGMMDATREIVRSPGMFDDRKTIPFVSNASVYMPSTLPGRLLGDSSGVDVSLRQSLFLSGSSDETLVIPNASVNKAAVDSQLAVLTVMETLNRPVDLSFNEHQKNYEATSSTDSFYATGSNTDSFGFNFSAPLKSKTQFHFSFPVNKQTTMPSLTSSIYYYNKQLKQWVDPLAGSGLSPVNIKTKVVSSAVKDGDWDSYRTYRVTETAIGFDAVGRKVVSGTLPFSTEIYQSDIAIGGFFNSPSPRWIQSSPPIVIDFVEKDEFSESTAIQKKYGNSLTDNTNFYPNEAQTFNVSVDYPFLIEKISVKIPFYIQGDWFKDKTTCNKAFGDIGVAGGYTSGSIDFGGPGITFSLLCARKTLNKSYIDIIASGTITHTNDNISTVQLYKDAHNGMKHYMLRPVGFNSFSNPSVIISGDENNTFEGDVALELVPSVAGGLTLARNDRSVKTYVPLVVPVGELDNVESNREKCIQLLTTTNLVVAGEDAFNALDMEAGTDLADYEARSTRVYLQQVSPLSRGSTGIEFNGNSILGGNIAAFNLESTVKNPLYYSDEASLSSELTTKINSSEFAFESVAIYSTVDSKESPYLIYPNDKLTISLSKTRPVAYKMFRTAPFGGVDDYGTYQLTGSHGTVMLNTGSIELTLYGSYVRGGVGFNP